MHCERDSSKSVHPREEGSLPYLLFCSGKPSQAASTRAIICLASLEQQTEASADLSGELLYLETVIGCDSE